MKLSKKTFYMCMFLLIVCCVAMGFQKTGYAANRKTRDYSFQFMQLGDIQGANSYKRRKREMNYSMYSYGYPTGRQALRIGDMGGFSYRRANTYNRMFNWGNAYSPSGRQSYGMYGMDNMGGFSYRRANTFSRMSNWANSYLRP